MELRTIMRGAAACSRLVNKRLISQPAHPWPGKPAISRVDAVTSFHIAESAMSSSTGGQPAMALAMKTEKPEEVMTTSSCGGIRAHREVPLPAQAAANDRLAARGWLSSLTPYRPLN